MEQPTREGELKEQPKQITITVEVNHDHDWCKIRRFLKGLLRSYGLKCVDIGKK